MIQVCAWCKKQIGEKPPYADKSVTHGICESCMKKQLGKNTPLSTDSGQAADLDPIGAHELLLYADNHADLYRQREVPIQQNLIKRWKAGTYDHAKAITLWKYWADDAAKRYNQEFGSDSKWFEMFAPATRLQVATEKAGHWRTEMELQHPRANPGASYRVAIRGGKWKYFHTLEQAKAYAEAVFRRTGNIVALEHTRKNPGAAWHAGLAKEARRYEKLFEKKGRPDVADFYHGKDIAHTESELMARASRNPHQQVGQAHVARFKGQRPQWAWTDPRARTTVYGVKADRPGVSNMVTANGQGTPYVVGLRTGTVWTDDPAWQNPRRTRSVSESHQRKIALDTLRMPDAMAGVMGGMTKAEARQWLIEHGLDVAAWEEEGRMQRGQKRIRTIVKRELGNPCHYTPAPRRRTVRNPIAIYGAGNPSTGSGQARLNGTIHAKIAGVVYNRIVDIKAQKTSFKPGYYRHPFSAKAQVQVLALDNGDLLVHSRAGVKLWKRD